MKFHYVTSLGKRPQSDGLLIPCCEEEEGFSFLHSMPEDVIEATSLLKKLKDFSGEKGKSIIVYQEEVYSSRLILVGLGPRKSIDGEQIREAYAKAISELSSKKLLTLVALLPELEERKPSWVLQAVMEGLVYGSYQFSRYKKQEGTYPEIFIPFDSLEEFFILDQRMVALKKALIAARDIVNMNADEKNPERFGRYFLSLAEGTGLQCSLYDEKWIQEEKMGLLLAVGQGSSTPPRMLVISWTPNISDRDHTVLVGKGITFDTGGLNLKPTGSIETMKCDMAGAAAVASVMLALADLNVQKNVTAVIPLAENGIGSKAFKPGDVFCARSGKTVEITNTDAEGRLILADALDWAVSTLHPTRIIDVATLTGACEVALGGEIFAVFANSDSLALEVERAAKRAGEAHWRLPLFQGYLEQLKSDIADCKNAQANRLGGAIIASLFLEKFVQDTPWVHLDIAGTAYFKDAKKYYCKGATGSPIRTLLEYLVPSV
jgi:leucyl aminopeptidase